MVPSLVLWKDGRRRTKKVIFGTAPGSVCRRQFRDATMDVLGVKTVVENDYEG